MAAPTPVSIYKGFVGAVLETTQGTGVYVPTFYFPIDAAPTFTPNVALLENKAFQGAPADVTGYVAGITDSNLGWQGNVFPDTIGFPLVGLLGEVAVSGTNPYTHTITALNSTNFQPPSYTLMYHYGMANTKAVPGFVFDELTIRVADGLCTYTTKGQGWTSSDQTKPTPSYTSATPMPGLYNTVSIAGSTTTIMLNGEVTIKRVVNQIHSLTGSADAAATWAGLLSVDAKMSLIMQDNTELARYTTPATTAVVWNINVGASSRLQFTFSKAQYLPSQPAWDSTMGLMTLPVSFKAVWNTTDVGASGGLSPLKAILVNAVATGSYK